MQTPGPTTIGVLRGPVDAVAPGVLAGVDWIEVADEHANTGALRQLGRPLLYSAPRGGRSEAERMRQVHEALAAYDMVALDTESDDPRLLDSVPRGRRVLDILARPDTDPPRAIGRAAALGARLIRYRPTHGDEVPPSLWPALAGRAIGYGAEDIAGRVLSAQLGAPYLVGELQAGHGPLLRALLGHYPGQAHPPRVLYGIAGATCGESVSPYLQNQAYARHGISAIFLPFPAKSLHNLWRSLRDPRGAPKSLSLANIPVRGFTITAPFKAEGLQLADEVSPLAAKVGFANILYEREGRCIADTSDVVIHRLIEEKLGRVYGRRAAVIGCGGAGMAVATSLQDGGAEVTLVNRGVERARAASARLGIPWTSLGGFDPGDLDVLVHATPVGRFDDALPVDPSALDPHTLVVDLVYRDTATPLTREALRRGHDVVDGHAVLQAEVDRQFEWMTGQIVRSPPLSGTATG